jgi:hypothetical protein
MIMGQSNIAAGATIGSNHNSRSADGEIIAGRGFWPGLCVSLKHNSKFSSFNIIAKGDYPVELNIPLPFSLISNDVSNDRLVVMPAYWFMYNMYALARNSTKYHERDKRIQKSQHIEFNYLAPDTVNEMFYALKIFESLQLNEKGDAEVEGWENSKRKTIITKVPQAAKCYKEMIKVYACLEIINQVKINKIGDFATLLQTLSLAKKREQWINVGGQLIQQKALDKLKTAIKSNKIKSWDDIHQFYSIQSSQYEYDKLNHAISSLMEVCNISVKNFTPAFLLSLFNEVLLIKDALNKSIYKTIEKDHSNPFRKMTYDNESEMVNVIGKIEDNTFIADQEKEFKLFKKDVTSLIKNWNLK